MSLGSVSTSFGSSQRDSIHQVAPASASGWRLDPTQVGIRGCDRLSEVNRGPLIERHIVAALDIDAGRMLVRTHVLTWLRAASGFSRSSPALQEAAATVRGQLARRLPGERARFQSRCRLLTGRSRE